MTNSQTTKPAGKTVSPDYSFRGLVIGPCSLLGHWPSVIGHSLLVLFLALCLTTSCSTRREPPQQRYDAAKALFDQTTKAFHTPSATAPAGEREKLLDQAARNYQMLLRRYPDQTNWCAQALRHLGNIRAAQTNLNEAVRQFTAVAEKYPGEEWEVIQAWKSAADLLWEANRPKEAKPFYQRIVQRFDGTNQPAVVRVVVRGSKSRLVE